MGRRQRDSEREQLWRQRLGRWRGSGQSARAFCLAEGIRESAFYFWRAELRRRGVAKSQPRVASPTFVPVTVWPSAAIEVRCPSGHVVTLPGGDATTLRMLFTVLATPSC